MVGCQGRTVVAKRQTREQYKITQSKYFSIKFNPSMLRKLIFQMVDFLHRISTLASSFYSRHHVLCQNLPHLLPVMYARIYLIKAILCAMQKLFDALNVTPIQNM